MKRLIHKSKFKAVTPLVMSIFLVLSAPCFAAKFYTWTDEKGVPNYSDKPDDNNTAETVDVYAPKPSSSASKSTGSQESPGTDDASEDSKNANAQHANSVEDYCKKLGDNIKTLETKSNITSVGADGKKTNLSKEEQKKTLDKSKQEYDSRCSAQ